MNSVEKMIQHSEEDRIYPERWSKAGAWVATATEPSDIPSGFGVINEYRTTLEVFVTTRCNDVQWRGGMNEKAKKRLMHAIFGEVRAHIQEAMYVVNSQDEDEIRRCLADALECCEP